MSNNFRTRAVNGRSSRDTVFLLGDLLPVSDFAGVLLAAWLGFLFYANGLSTGMAPPGLSADAARAALAAAVLAPFILCDRTFVSFARDGQSADFMRCYAVRFLLLAGACIAIGRASPVLASLPLAWLAWWLVSALLVTLLTRALLIGYALRLKRNGALAETVAVIGAGATADQLIRQLQQTRGDRITILGVFDDRVRREGEHPPAGSIADLITLGQSRSMDWMLLALPAGAESRRLSFVHRLKSLAVPVGLPGLPWPPQADLSRRRWDAAVNTAETVLPRWIITQLSLVLNALGFLVTAVRKLGARPTPASALGEKLTCVLDPYDVPRFTIVAARFGQTRFGYVVTPNADHLIRLDREPSFRALYAEASYVLLDSRFISHLLRLTRKLRLPVCTGSDLTASLFDQIIMPDDPLVLVGGSADQAACISARYGLNRLAHFNPAMGFIHDPQAVEDCLQFIEAQSPFRYCLLAVGAPQQEMLAQSLKTRGVARGLALCIGCSIDFLTGREQRAPLWMQHSGLEWLFRLTQAPGRMAGRYLVRGPQVFSVLRRTEIVLRAAPNSPQSAVPAIPTPRPAPALFSNPFAGSRAAHARRANARRDP